MQEQEEEDEEAEEEEEEEVNMQEKDGQRLPSGHSPVMLSLDRIYIKCQFCQIHPS